MAKLVPQKITLTGATGFIGQHLSRRLMSDGYDVSALILPGEKSQLPSHVTCLPVDITDATGVTDALQAFTPTHIIHLAAVGVTSPGLSFHESWRVNVQGVINVLEAVQTLPAVERVLLVGSSYEYGARRSDDEVDPVNAYGASKLAGWAYARAAYNLWHLPVVWVRPFQVYGPGQPVHTLVPAAIHAALAGEDFRMTPGAQQRDFIYINDLIDGLVAVLFQKDLAGRTLDLATGQLTPLIDVVTAIWKLTGAQGRILAGALPYRSGEVPAIPANVHRTRLLTNWEATVSLEQGLRWTIQAIDEALKSRTAEGAW